MLHVPRLTDIGDFVCNYSSCSLAYITRLAKPVKIKFTSFDRGRYFSSAINVMGGWPERGHRPLD